MRQSEIEEGIVESGVEQREEQHIPPVAPLADGKLPMRCAGDRKDDKSRYAESDARKEHLATRHVGSNLKLLNLLLIILVCKVNTFIPTGKMFCCFSPFILSYLTLLI